MINRIKQWNFKNFKINDKSIINFSLFLSIFALVLSIPSGTPCLSANECQVGSDATFTNDVNIKSGTNYNLTLGHNYAQNVIANFEEVGGNHTGSVILKDNSGDMNLNGGLVLGTSATSTNGTIRWNGSEVQVYNSGWTGIGSTPTDDIGQVTADSGSFTASSQQDNINIVGGTNITTSITSDTLTINASTPAPSTEYANFHLSSDQTMNYSGFGSSSNIDFDTERFDTENCFSADSSGTITYDSGCNSAFYNIQLTNIINFSGLTNNQAMIQGAMNAGTGGYNYRTWVTLMSTANYTLNFNRIACLDPSDTITINFFHGQGYSTGSAKWLSGTDDSSLSLIKLNEKGSSC
jgi:hypothetical protein